MRKLSEITTPILPAAPAGRSYDRRPLPTAFAGFTCVVLVKHQASGDGKDLFVSTDCDAVGAVWVPRAMLGLDRTDRGRFLVATLSKAFAGEKRLDAGSISHERLAPDESAQLTAAQEAAKRTRARFRGDRTSRLSHIGRNEFA
jgi:hypothetical protein